MSGGSGYLLNEDGDKKPRKLHKNGSQMYSASRLRCRTCEIEAILELRAIWQSVLESVEKNTKRRVKNARKLFVPDSARNCNISERTHD
jgi:hypothetical protein